MRHVFSALAALGILTAAATGVSAKSPVTRSYVKAPYNYTCIMSGKTETCGNWNVYTPLKAK